VDPLTRHTSYRTRIFADGRSVVAEFCMKEGLAWPCDAELRDRELDRLRLALVEARRWVEWIGAINLGTGRRIVKADALAVIGAALAPEEVR
jgi:hypothetical protein